MTQIPTTSETTEAVPATVQLTLTWAEAEQLRTTLPWLLRALAERPTTPASQRTRRRKASAALERLLTALIGEVQQTAEDPLSQ